MAAISRFKYFYLAHFSKPASDRALYRLIRRHKIRTILEVGVGNGRRALRLIETAQRYSPPAEVRYTAVDLFEARAADAPQGLALKQAHRLLAPTGARVQLVPGDPYTALARAANALQNTDLVLISAGLDADSLRRAWFYVPRMLHAGSLVFEVAADGLTPVLVERATLDARAAAFTRRQAA